MASTMNTIDKIIDCLKIGSSFILDAGAGSGKTYSLIETLQYIIKHKDNYLPHIDQKIACITFTNRAKDEIGRRIENSKYVHISTIHEFLWSLIGQFQYDLKELFSSYIDQLIADNMIKHEVATGKRKNGIADRITKLKDDKQQFLNSNNSIKYKDYYIYSEGVISHNDVISISKRMFVQHNVLKRLTAGCYPIILIDEYQDTNKETVELLLDHLLPEEKILMGFFGDKMQHIYENGIGEIPNKYPLVSIKKEENYRCSLCVINFLNKIRTDIKQFPGLPDQPKGDCRYYINESMNISGLDTFVNELRQQWNLKEEENVKQLILTHRYITKALDCGELYNHYSRNNKPLLDNSSNRGICVYADILHDTFDLIEVYNSGSINFFLNMTPFVLNSVADKITLNQSMKILINSIDDWTILDLLKFVGRNNLLKIEKDLLDIEKIDIEKKDLMVIPARQFAKIHKYVNDKTPFSTKHGTKGEEYDHVLVVIDDKLWFQYSFNQYIEGNKSKNIQRYNRTENLFYVVCSRARINLAVLWLSEVSELAEARLKELFSMS